MSAKVIINGRRIPLSKREVKDLKGITIGDKIGFEFFDGAFQELNLLFVRPKNSNPTPRNCAFMADRLKKLFRLPVVFILKPGPTYERQRLVDKGVYFVMSDKYAFLPTLIALECVGNRKRPIRLTPVAQYLLLYHLQVASLENMSAMAIKENVPYSYESITLGITCLADLGLCTKINVGSKSKAIHFPLSGKALWEKAKPYLINPVEKIVYCDELRNGESFPVCGINALAKHSRLNPDSENWVAITAKGFRKLKSEEAFVNLNPFDGQVIVEVWKYPPIKQIEASENCVDKLSLALSLANDDDPRVEQEVEYIIENMKW